MSLSLNIYFSSDQEHLGFTIATEKVQTWQFAFEKLSIFFLFFLFYFIVYIYKFYIYINFIYINYIL